MGFGNIALIILLCFALLIIWAPVIYLILRISFAIKRCKFNYRSNSLTQEINCSRFHENKIHECTNFRFGYKISALDTKRQSSFSSPSFSNNYSARTNPASGLPMVGSSSIDSNGNVYGIRRF